MKTVKKKLVAAIAMLLVATVMMTSASFAWYSVTVGTEVEDIQTVMLATNNFEIAKATTEDDPPEDDVSVNDVANDAAWGASITYGANTLELNAPATVPENEDNAASNATEADKVTGKLSTVIYGEGGLTAGLIPATAGDLENGVGRYTYVDENGDTKNCAVVYGMWLRTNTEGDVSVKVHDAMMCKYSETLSLTDHKIDTAAEGSSLCIYFQVNDGELIRANFKETTATYEAILGTAGPALTEEEKAADPTAEDPEFIVDEPVLVRVVMFSNGEGLYASAAAGARVQLSKVEYLNNGIPGTVGVVPETPDPEP